MKSKSTDGKGKHKVKFCCNPTYVFLKIIILCKNTIKTIGIIGKYGGRATLRNFSSDTFF